MEFTQGCGNDVMEVNYHSILLNTKLKHLVYGTNQFLTHHLNYMLLSIDRQRLGYMVLGIDQQRLGLLGLETLSTFNNINVTSTSIQLKYCITIFNIPKSESHR